MTTKMRMMKPIWKLLKLIIGKGGEDDAEEVVGDDVSAKVEVASLEVPIDFENLLIVKEEALKVAEPDGGDPHDVDVSLNEGETDVIVDDGDDCDHGGACDDGDEILQFHGHLCWRMSSDLISPLNPLVVLAS